MKNIGNPKDLYIPISDIRYRINDKMENNNYNNWGMWGRRHLRMSFGQKGWLRPMVLNILEKGPMNGVEIMNKIGEMSHGWWKPSPGSVYPLLQTLSDEKLIKKLPDGKYELTDKYKKEFGSSDETENILTNMESEIYYLKDLSQTNKTEFNKYKNKINKLKNEFSQLK